MTVYTSLRRSAITLVATVAVAVPAMSFAQDQSTRLFGEGGTTTLGAIVRVYGGYDRADSKTRVASGEAERVGSGTSLGSTASLNLARPISRASLGASVSTDLRYYTSLGALSGVTAQSSSAALTLGAPLGRRTTFNVTQGFTTSSFYVYNPFSGLSLSPENDPTLATADYRLDRGRTYSYDLRSTVDVQTGRFSHLTFDYHTRMVNFPGEQVAFRTQGGGGRFQRRLSPRLSFVAGYGYDYGGAAAGAKGSGYHRLDLGLSIGQRLPFSQDTTFSLTTGGAVFAKNDRAGVERSRPFVTVTAGLRRPIRRTWVTGVEYRREPQFVEYFSDPSYSDTVAGLFQGRVTSRTGLVFSGGYRRSTFDFSGSGTSETIYAAARLAFAATRSLATYVEYGYYYFDGERTVLTQPIGSHVGRNALRGGLSWSLPLRAARQTP